MGVAEMSSIAPWRPQITNRSGHHTVERSARTSERSTRHEFKMTHPTHASDELADEAVMELVDRLFDRWQLDEQTRRRLLSTDPVPRHVESEESSAAMERARQLLNIHAGLRCLFPDDPELRWTWVTRRNQALDGSTPLDVMLAGRDGTLKVLRLVRRDVGA